MVLKLTFKAALLALVVQSAACAQTIAVLSPNGGEVLQPGKTYAISWNASGVSGKAHVYLYRNWTRLRVLGTAQAAAGVRSWTVPADEPTGCDYRIRVSPVANLAAGDYSDRVFIIGAPSLRVLSPDGGETFTTGDTTTVSWVAQDISGTVRIYLYRNWVKLGILANAPATNGQWSWSIPQDEPPANNYRIRVQSLLNTAISDYGDGVFAICKPAVRDMIRAFQIPRATACAEEDNVYVPLEGEISSFYVEATHPVYEVGTDNCEADFTNCSSNGDGYAFPPRSPLTLYDDHQEILVQAVWETVWWRPTGMTVWVDDGEAATDVHYVRISRRIPGTNEWPECLVVYMDGNLRLIPLPPEGRTSVCYGGSVVVGPVETTLTVPPRPIAEIASVRYRSASKTLELVYKSGGSAVLGIETFDRTRGRVRVDVSYPVSALPFAAYQSMYVEDSNADVDHVQWTNAEGEEHDESVVTFSGDTAPDWFFHRVTRSIHNTSAPDIRIGSL